MRVLLLLTIIPMLWAQEAQPQKVEEDTEEYFPL